MNEEEAIETYKNFLDDISKNGGCTIDIDFQHKKEYEAMWKILNFIEKCKSNVNAKNKRLKEYAEELEKKDKVIHLMAKDIKEADKFLDSMGYLGEYEGYTIEGIIEEYNQEIEKGE